MVLVIWLIISFAPDLVVCASSGAKLSACDDMMPRHVGGKQTSVSPYMLIATNTTYSCGNNITVTLKTNDVEGFKGFLCQSRSGTALSQYVTYGTLNPGGDVDMVNNCDTDGSLTHAEPGVKYSASFVWTAPDDDVGPVIIACTVVKFYATFWTNVTSAVISHEGECNTSNVTSTSETPTSSSTTLSDVVLTSSPNINSTEDNSSSVAMSLAFRMNFIFIFNMIVTLFNSL